MRFSYASAYDTSASLSGRPSTLLWRIVRNYPGPPRDLGNYGKPRRYGTGTSVLRGRHRSVACARVCGVPHNDSLFDLGGLRSSLGKAHWRNRSELLAADLR